METDRSIFYLTMVLFESVHLFSLRLCHMLNLNCFQCHQAADLLAMCPTEGDSRLIDQLKPILPLGVQQFHWDVICVLGSDLLPLQSLCLDRLPPRARNQLDDPVEVVHPDRVGQSMPLTLIVERVECHLSVAVKNSEVKSQPAFAIQIVQAHGALSPQ